jgi:hypothetical protein
MMTQAMVSLIITSSDIAKKFVSTLLGSSIINPTNTPASSDSMGRRLSMAVTTVTIDGSNTSQLVSEDIKLTLMVF